MKQGRQRLSTMSVRDRLPCTSYSFLCISCSTKVHDDDDLDMSSLGKPVGAFRNRPSPSTQVSEAPSAEPSYSGDVPHKAKKKKKKMSDIM